MLNGQYQSAKNSSTNQMQIIEFSLICSQNDVKEITHTHQLVRSVQIKKVDKMGSKCIVFVILYQGIYIKISCPSVRFLLKVCHKWCKHYMQKKSFKENRTLDQISIQQCSTLR